MRDRRIVTPEVVGSGPTRGADSAFNRALRISSLRGLGVPASFALAMVTAPGSAHPGVWNSRARRSHWDRNVDAMEPLDGRLVEVEILWDGAGDRASYPFCIPAISAVSTLSVDRPVTFLVGENGSGKSTLLEAIAVAAGLNAEGGSKNLTFATRSSHSDLHEHLRLSWRGRPRRAFFLRAESFYNVATSYDEVLTELPSLHERSHGESFIEAIHRHFGSHGFFLLDEPESALSLRGQLALMRHMHDSIGDGSQFVISTHSPILLAYPGAVIYEMTNAGPEPIEYEQTDQYELTKSFLDDPERFLRHLFSDD